MTSTLKSGPTATSTFNPAPASTPVNPLRSRDWVITGPSLSKSWSIQVNSFHNSDLGNFGPVMAMPPAKHNTAMAKLIAAMLAKVRNMVRLLGLVGQLEYAVMQPRIPDESVHKADNNQRENCNGANSSRDHSQAKQDGGEWAAKRIRERAERQCRGAANENSGACKIKRSENRGPCQQQGEKENDINGSHAYQSNNRRHRVSGCPALFPALQPT